MNAKNIIIKKKISTKLGDYSGPFVTPDEAVEKLEIVMKVHKEAKSVSYKLRNNFINEYIARGAEDCKVSPKVMKNVLQRELGRISKYIFEQNTRAPVLKATVMCPVTRVTTTIETKNEIVKAATESNYCCQCKT